MLPTTTAISSANDLLASHAALISRVRQAQQDRRRQLHTLLPTPHDLLRLPFIPSPSPTPPLSDSPPDSPTYDSAEVLPRLDLPPAKRARVTRYRRYVPEEETIRNDYSQRYVDGGEWPQNWVLGAEPEHRFEEYPKQQRLLNLKKTSVSNHSLPPSYMSYSNLSSLHPCKFDVILLDPPFSSSFTWEHLQELPIPTLAADPSFVFLWVGSGAGEGLERGREVLAKWGYRRCEDVVWVKTNHAANKGPGTDPPTTSLLTRTKQHCLIGIRGTVRRSTDSWFVHCNIDTDVIIWEGDPADPTRKPPEMYTLIENFCLGIRRLEIFGRASSSLRRGWVTVLGPGQEAHMPPSDVDGRGLIHVDGDEGGEASRWDRESWEEGIRQLSNGGKAVVPMTSDIDALRPKSPFRPNNQSTPSGNGGTSGAVSLGVGPPNNSAPRFNQPNRPAFMGTIIPQGPPQNQLMGPPLVGMQMNPHNNMGMGNPIVFDDMMGGWNPMMTGMGGMSLPPMAHSMGNINVPGMNLPMMGQMGLGGGFQGQGGTYGSGGGVYNGGMGNAGMNWNDQGQFSMDGSWEGENIMRVGVSGMGPPRMSMGSMGGMGGMNPSGMGLMGGMGNVMGNLNHNVNGMGNMNSGAAGMGNMGSGGMVPQWPPRNGGFDGFR